jgi:hypothetical protein
VPGYWNSGRYQTHTVLKIAFENNAGGTNLALCAGTDADFAAGTVGLQLSDSGGPGFQLLTIIDTNKLSGKIIRLSMFFGQLEARIRSSR